MNFEKPDYKITDYVENNNYGKFELEPLERGFGMTIGNALRRVMLSSMPGSRGFGMTIGNALRRVMLSSMPGSAIVAVKIDGVMHEFQTIEGVIEDVTAIILNLKGIAIRNHSDEVKTAHLSVHEERTVTASDIVCDSDIEIINKDQVIATLAKGGKLDMEFIIANGRGADLSNVNKKYITDTTLGYIPIDALYSPIERVNFEVDNARVGQDASYDKLIMENLNLSL